MSQYDTQSQSDEGWATAEQWFMRALAAALLVTAVISIFFQPFQTRDGINLIQGINIAVTLLLGLGSLWSFWYSADINRIYNLIDGFKENGNGRTYLAAIMQAFVGFLFASELANGRITLGILGVIILASAVFFVWRAQQINKFRY